MLLDPIAERGTPDLSLLVRSCGITKFTSEVSNPIKYDSPVISLPRRIIPNEI
jgi:hypothetical protein